MISRVGSAAVAPRTIGPGLTDHLVDWSMHLALDTLPAAATEVATQCLLDWLTVTVAGAREPLCDLLADELGIDGDGDATLVGRAGRARVVDAALVNGAASHALDYDDVHLAMPGHPSAPVFAALVGVAEAAQLDGRRFLRAAVVGLESELRLGELAAPDHYERGWHATATIGAIGAAIACADALGADDDQRRHAIGLAVSQAAGSKAMFGSMAKPLQVGRAASSGALAARLAVRGMTAHPASLEDPQGFLALYADGDVVPAWRDDRLLLVDTLFKYHAACYFTHAGIEAAARLRARGVRAGEVVAVRVETNPKNLLVCDLRRPTTGLETKFSMVATVAMALLGVDTAAPESYGETTLADPALHRLIERVGVTASDQLERTQMVVTVEQRDGRTTQEWADSGVPATDLRAQRDRLEDKCRRLVTPRLGEARTVQLLEGVRSLVDQDDVGAALRAATVVAD